MASFNLVGLNDIEKQFLRESEVVSEAVPKMLEAGAEVLVNAQKQEAKALQVEDKGDLIKSIKAGKVKKTDLEATISVYPSGKNSKGIRNAEVGFVNEYGTSRQSARPWMESANEKSSEAVSQAMLDKWEELSDD